MNLALTIPGDSGPVAIPTPQGIATYSINAVLSFAITTILVVAILLTLFFLIYGGIDMISSGGDKQKVTNARQKLTFAIVGLIIVLLSFFIVNTIGNIFGITFFGSQ